MLRKLKPAILPSAILFTGFVLFGVIQATAQEPPKKKPIDPRPTVAVMQPSAIDYRVQITAFGEVQAKESTKLSAQVSGEIVSLNDKFIAGGLVKRGEVLFSVEADMYEANYLSAQADVARAQAALIEEKARAQVAQREAQNLPQNKVTDLYLRKPQLLSAAAALKSAQARLQIAKIDLDNTQVRAPYDALIEDRLIGLGSYVNRGAQVAMLHNVEQAEVIIPIAGFDAVFLDQNTIGQAAMVTIENNGVQRRGIIKRDLGIVDERTRMSHFVIEIDDPYALQQTQPAIKFGNYATVTFAGKALQQVYKLPQTLVTNRKVWVADEEDKMRAIAVDVIREEGSDFYIQSGLNESDRVITTLPEFPANGLAVKIIDKQTNSAEIAE